jgi:uncharacterized phage protein (TIGR01671 family)
VYGYYVEAGHWQHIFNADKFGSLDAYKVDPATVGQYTGLKDKGGTESYHKDIVRTNAEQVGVVEFGSYSPTGNEWDNTWGWFIQFPNGGQISMDEHFRCWGEVVGNIYDNPELLEGGKIDAY